MEEDRGHQLGAAQRLCPHLLCFPSGPAPVDTQGWRLGLAGLPPAPNTSCPVHQHCWEEDVLASLPHPMLLFLAVQIFQEAIGTR